MSELSQMAVPLLEGSLLPRPTLDQLRRRNARRRRRRTAGLAGTVAMVALAVVLVVNVLPGAAPSRTGPPPSTGSHLAAYIQTAVSVPDSVLQQVGLPSDVIPPTALSGLPPLTRNGKSVTVYVGAEYCPFCAVARWGLVVALSRFGDFTRLGHVVSSSSTDVYPNLKSWSFFGSSFESPSVHFDPTEMTSTQANSAGTGYVPLQKLSPLERQVWHQLDTSAHDHILQRGESGAIPFVDFGNRYLVVGSSASPSVLEGLSLSQIAADLGNPSSPVAQQIDGVADYFIAALCLTTGDSGGGACSLPVIRQAESVLTGSQ